MEKSGFSRRLMQTILTSYFGRARIDRARYCIDHVSRELAASQGSHQKKKSFLAPILRELAARQASIAVDGLEW